MVSVMLEPTAIMKCIQKILFAFNAIFTFTGFILILVGCTIDDVNLGYTKYLETRICPPSLLIIGIGCLVFVIALFGCYGAYKLSVAAITLFCFMLVIVYVLELGVGLFAYVMRDQIGNLLMTSLKKTLTEYETDPVATNAIDNLQYGFHCCGIRGPDDWTKVITSSPSNIIVPASCCAFYENNNCTIVKNVGCLAKLEFCIKQNSLMLVSAVLMMALIQLLGVIFAYKLARELRQQKSLRDHFVWEVKENVINDDTAFLSEYFRLPSYSELFSNSANTVHEKK